MDTARGERMNYIDRFIEIRDEIIAKTKNELAGDELLTASLTILHEEAKDERMNRIREDRVKKQHKETMWRSEQISDPQKKLIKDLKGDPDKFKTKGEAHDYIKELKGEK